MAACKGRSTVKNRPAFTLVEILLAVGLFCLVATAVHFLLLQAHRTEAKIEGGLDAEQAIRLALHRLCIEIREARRVFLPAYYGQTGDGLGFINTAGESVVWYIEKTKENTGKLIRSCINTREKEIVLDRLEDFRATLYPSIPGKQASTIGLFLAVKERAVAKTRSRTHTQFTRVFLRNVEVAHPEE